MGMVRRRRRRRNRSRRMIRMMMMLMLVTAPPFRTRYLSGSCSFLCLASAAGSHCV
jgi:hypothetical protein